MSLLDDLLTIINDEVTNDPNNVGYAGKTPDVVALLLSNPVYRTSVIGYEEVAPINRILSNIPGPNLVTEGDILDSQSLAASRPVTITVTAL